MSNPSDPTGPAGEPGSSSLPSYGESGATQDPGYGQAPMFGPSGDYGQPPPGMYFDPDSGLLIPEGVELASHGRRIGAWFLAIPLAIVTLVIGYIIWGLIIWGRGQTPALQVLRMRCWRPTEGRPAGFWWMALREIVGRFVEGILGIITQVTSLVLFLATRERRALHDFIAGTVVFHDPTNLLEQRR